MDKKLYNSFIFGEDELGEDYDGTSGEALEEDNFDNDEDEDDGGNESEQEYNEDEDDKEDVDNEEDVDDKSGEK